MSSSPQHQQAKKTISLYFKCDHEKKVTKSGVSNCYSCGVMIPDNGQVAYKSAKLNFGTQFNPQKCLKSIKKIRQPTVEIDQNSEYFKSRSQLIEYMWDISEKLRLTLNTTHLSIYFMDFVNSVVNVPSSQFSIYAATAVMLGAKAIELDERIPFISKLKRYSGLYNKTNEFTKVEGVFVKALNWNLQCVTLIDVLDFYMAQGVVFSNDQQQQKSDDVSTPKNIEENALKEKNMNSSNNIQAQIQQNNSGKEQQDGSQQELKSPINQIISGIEKMDISPESNVSTKSSNDSSNTSTLKDLSESQIYQMVTKIEKEYPRIANLIIRDTQYYKYELNTLTTACVAFLRFMSGIHCKWNESLEKLSAGVKEEDFKECYEQIYNQFNTYFLPSYQQQKAAANGKKMGMQLKHSKTTDIQDVENKNIHLSNNNNAGITQSIYSSNTKINNLSSQNQVNFNNNHSNNNSAYVSQFSSDLKKQQAYPISSNDLITFNQFNSNSSQLSLHHHHSNNTYLHSNSNGISTMNNNNLFHRQSSGVVQTSSQQQQGFSAQQLNNRLSGSSYIQKVYRVNSGNVI